MHHETMLPRPSRGFSIHFRCSNQPAASPAAVTGVAGRNSSTTDSGRERRACYPVVEILRASSGVLAASSAKGEDHQLYSRPLHGTQRRQRFLMEQSLARKYAAKRQPHLATDRDRTLVSTRKNSRGICRAGEAPGQNSSSRKNGDWLRNSTLLTPREIRQFPSRNFGACTRFSSPHTPTTGCQGFACCCCPADKDRRRHCSSVRRSDRHRSPAD